MELEGRLGIEAGRNPQEAEFLAALYARAVSGSWHADAWPWEDRLIITISPSDSEANTILRTLRADYFGDRVVVGLDPTHQLAGDLDGARADVFSKASPSPAELAEFAADWLERELARPIDRLEWKSWTYEHREWVLADSGQVIVCSDSKNRTDRKLGKPTRRVRVHGHERPASE
jgi:hypothetical protein